MNTETNYTEHFYADINNDIDTLRKNVDENPFSSVAQFLLLYNYKKNNDPSFEEYARKAAIYFNNIPWIQYQLLGNNTDHFSPPLPSTELHEEIIPADARLNDAFGQEEIIQNPVQESETEEEATNATSNISDNIQTLGTDEISETNFTADEPIIQNPIQEPETENEATNETSNISDNIQTLGTDEIPETSFTANEPIIQNPVQEPETENEATKDTSNISDNIQTLGTDEIPETNFTADARLNDAFGQEEIIQNPVEKSETENEVTKDTSNISDNIQTLGTDEILETNFTADESIIQNPVQESENEEEPVAFEPLHTVDYFASQGIKISEEALENDHLGQQVKSFTAWLKSMKKLHPGQLPEQNEVIEKIIQSSAEASNQNANVLTEAMAEVLIKQGKKEKAVEMYQKLSLMNPSKSTYFAAKIESLKTI